MQVLDKKSLRSFMRTQRKALSAQDVQTASAQICDRVLMLPSIEHARSILLYLPIQNEVDTWCLCDHFWKRKTEVLLPRCHENRLGCMDIFCVTDSSQLGPGKFDIPEPLRSKAELCDNPKPDIIFVPALAYDERGFRLGYGGGYYDRYLSTAGQHALTIGLAYDFQIIQNLPVDPWDLPVNLVMTPTRTITIHKENS